MDDRGINLTPSRDEPENQSAGGWLARALGVKLARGLLVLGVLSFVFYFLAVNDVVYRGGGLIERKAALEAENLFIEEENRQLMARIERLGQDPEFIEDEARRKLRLIKPGEIIYRLVEEPDLSDDEAADLIQR
jgi:cell division protein FtsB